MPVHLDFEIRSAVNLKNHGAFRWLEDPSSRILCLAYSIDGAPVSLWWPWFPLIPEELKHPDLSFLVGAEPPLELFERIEAGDELWAHNATFERAAFELVCGPRLGWPVPDPTQWRCTMAMCAAHALPLSLEGACRVLGLPERKDERGARIMRKLTQPRRRTKKDWSRWHERPNELRQLFAYCAQDVRTEMGLARILRPLSATELEVYHVDQAVNFRGVQVDLELCEAADQAGKLRAVKLKDEVHRLTGGEVESFTQVECQKAWLKERGVILPDLTKETVRDALARDEAEAQNNGDPMPAECRRLLSLRTAGGKTSVAKFAKFIQTTSADGRLRAGYQYHGARTGRWAGRGAQLHNLTKGVSQEDQEWIIHTVKKGGLPLMELFWTDPIHKLSTVIRGALVAAPGMKLVVADYSAIEARGVAWLSGQDDLLELYREGVDLYCWMAGHVFECDPDEVLERYHAGDPFRRFVGKQLVLGCGYQMGASRFRSYCAGMGVAISEALAERGVAIYRERTPMIRAHWKGVEAAAIAAVQNPGKQYKYRKTKWKKVGRFLHVQLPSGRILSYYRPFVKKETVKIPEKRLQDGTIREAHTFEAWKLRYHGMKDHRWGRIATFGGSLTENVCQATTRDLMADAMVRLERMDLAVVMHSHDELILEVTEEFNDAAGMLTYQMEQIPPWAEGLPVKVEAWEGRRYRK